MPEGIEAIGSMPSTAGPDCNQNDASVSGSEASTQVSLVSAPACW